MTDEVRKHEVLRRSGGPRLKGRVVSETAESIALECSGCVVEFQPEHIVSRRADEAGIECALTDDATVIVSVRVLPNRRIVGDNVFGSLIEQGLLSDNCNCNCNCSGGNCNCNCNCNCTECSVCTLPQRTGQAPISRFRVRLTR